MRTTKPQDITFDPNYRSKFLHLTEEQQYRLLEIIPGFLVWTTFIGAVIISFVKPLWAIYFIIVFDLYWLFRILYLLVYLINSWHRFHQTIKIDWLVKLKKDYPHWHQYYHLIFLPTYKEPFEVIDKTFASLKAANYDKQKMILVLAGEERDKENFLKIAEAIKQKYQNVFHSLLITVHPKDLPDEIPGKGSNLNWAGHRAKEYIDKLQLDYDKIIVSAFDIDTRAHPQYFAYLTYKYLSVEKPTRTSYQPIAVYNNNIWETPAPIRIIAYSTTFWLLTDLARPERLFTFSSHSMSFRMLVDVGFWQKDIVTEDSRIFLQGFCHYNGDYRVEPMYIPVYMNTVYTGGLWQGFVDQYKQMRRWAWGVENFPYQAWFFLKVRNLPLKKGLHYLWNQLEGVYSWATAPIIISLLGFLPLRISENIDKTTVIAQNAPIILQWVMTIAMIGLVFSAIFTTRLMPPLPPDKSKWNYLVVLLQWVMFPLGMIIFGSIPAADAQTRLMTGKYLGFWVSKKK